MANSPQKPFKLNNTDRLILGLLREDARMNISEMAARLNISRTTVKNRIDLLCERNVIKRFTIELDTEHAQNGVPSSAFFILQLKRRMCRLIYEKIRGWPELVQAWSLSGQNDMLILVRTVDNDGIENLRSKLIRDSEILNVETVMVLSEWIRKPDQPEEKTTALPKGLENLQLTPLQTGA